MSGLLIRILGLREGGGSRMAVVLERNWMFYRRSWFIIVTGFFEPLFYLLAIGLGLGTLVPEVVGPDGQTIAYVSFVAPGMMAASAMNGAIFESSVNTWVKLRFWKLFDAMLATPLRPLDIAVGEISFSQIRGALYASAFLGFAALVGGVPSWWGLLAIPGAMLVGFAFSAIGTLAATWIRDWQDNELLQAVLLPILLLSGTFFPLEVYPHVLQPFVWLSPLYHGAQLLRGLTLGALSPALLGHAGVLVAVTLAASAAAARRFERLLKP